jgi:hypothetical protein
MYDYVTMTDMYTGLSVSILFQVYQYFTIPGSIFFLNLNNCHEYLIQHSLKSGGDKDNLFYVGKSTWYHLVLKGLCTILQNIWIFRNEII